jgi:hypothetical protein
VYAKDGVDSGNLNATLTGTGALLTALDAGNVTGTLVVASEERGSLQITSSKMVGNGTGGGPDTHQPTGTTPIRDLGSNAAPTQALSVTGITTVSGSVTAASFSGAGSAVTALNAGTNQPVR